MIPRILFYTAGGRHPQYNTGHLSRCIQTCEKILKTNSHAQFRFVMPADRLGEKILIKAGYKPVTYKTASERKKRLEDLFLKWGADIIVLDRLDCPAAFVRGLRKFKKVIISVDDSGEAAKLADISINPLIPNPFSDYSGYAYLLLSSNYREVRMRSPARHCLISFGGGEPANLTLKLLNVLKKQKDAACVNFHVFGSIQRDQAASVKKVLACFGKESRFYPYSPGFYDVLARVDTAIVGGGLTMFEASRRGIATGVFELRSHQKYNIQKLAARRVISDLGSWTDVESSQSQKKIAELFQKPAKRKSLNQKSKIFWRNLRRDTTYEKLIQIVTPDTGRFARIWPQKTTDAIRRYAAQYCQRYQRKILVTGREYEIS